MKTIARSLELFESPPGDIEFERGIDMFKWNLRDVGYVLPSTDSLPTWVLINPHEVKK